MPGVPPVRSVDRLLGLLPLTLEVSHGDVEAVLSEFDGDAASDAARRPSHDCNLMSVIASFPSGSMCRHRCLRTNMPPTYIESDYIGKAHASHMQLAAYAGTYQGEGGGMLDDGGIHAIVNA